MNLGTKVWQLGRNAALGAAEYMTPVLAESQFLEKGVLTPEEFVAAGDMLVLRCPTWQWQAGDPAKARPFLPPNKQYLLTRNVPCQQRAAGLGSGADDEQALDDGAGEEWTATHTSHAKRTDDDAPDMAALSLGGGGASSSAAAAASSSAAEREPVYDDDLEDAELVEAEDPSALDPAEAGAANIVRTRTYDVSLTYDKYYQCAHVWLYGYSESRQPLTQEAVLEDISADHALKTVTLEAHPHTAVGAGLHASIHPCKHAAVMQKLVQAQVDGGKEVKPEAYLFLFLKFISCIIPTIEYDHTIAVDGA